MAVTSTAMTTRKGPCCHWVQPVQSSAIGYPQKSSCAGLTRASTSPFSRLHDVDGRDKHGHDDSKGYVLSLGATGFAQPDSRGPDRPSSVMRGSSPCMTECLRLLGWGRPPIIRGRPNL